MNNKKIREWEMERYLLGGLSEERIREVEKQIKENPRIREVLMRLKRSNEEILKQLSPEEMIPKNASY